MSNNKHELTDLLLSIIPITFYKGCTVIYDRKIEKYVVLGKECITPGEVDTVIDNAKQALKNSIKK